MRIVAGKYGGRQLQVPKGRDIRPTSDKVRGAIFNVLQSYGVLDGAQVIDGFCGTGALGLEALSRGGAGCTFIDSARTSLDLAQANAKNLGARAAEFVLKNLSKPFSKGNISSADLVFLDPPYGQNMAGLALKNLHDALLLKRNSFVVLEVEKGFSAPLPEFVSVDKEKIYGDTKVLFLQSRFS